MKDNEIIDLFLARDEKAIEAVSAKYHPYCYKIAWNLLANKEDAEECLNDTWFSVWSRIPPARPLALAQFCGQITRNLSIDRLRKKHAGKRPDVHMADVLGEMDQLNIAYTMDDQLAEKELLKVINDFLGKLKAEDRDTFCKKILVSGFYCRNFQKTSYVSWKCKNESVQKSKETAEGAGKRRRPPMKKFDFSKEFGNIDSKYISEAEEEWKGKKNIWTPTFLEQSGSSMRDCGIGLRNFFQTRRYRPQ